MSIRLVLNVGGLTLLEILVLVLFAINVTWILFPLATAFVGLVRSIARRRRRHDIRPLHSRTALVMPTYNEDPAQVLGVQNAFAKPEYFTRSYTLFPLWPHLDPVRAMRLFGFTLAILFGPKALGFLWFIASPKRLRGGGILLPISLAFEVLLSALIAPILMLIDCGNVLDILRGKDSDWRPQRRADDSLLWSQVLYRHRWHMAMGAVLIAVSRFISWQMLAWLLPLSQWTGSAAVGRWFRRIGILRVPTEAEPPAIVKKAQEIYPIYRDVAAAAPDLLTIASDRENLERHLALVDPAPHDDIDLVRATANLKIERAGTRQEAVAVLTPQECARVQSMPELLLRIFALPDRAEVADEE
jgi:membrane glycosyltransferase